MNKNKNKNKKKYIKWKRIYLLIIINITYIT